MKLYENATYWFLVTVFLGLIVSYTYGDVAIVTSDEIGDDIVMLIKQELKDPFLNLLASSTHASKQDMQNRVDAAEKAFSKFKGSYLNMIGQQVASLPQAAPQSMGSMSIQPISDQMGAMQPSMSQMPQTNTQIASEVALPNAITTVQETQSSPANQEIPSMPVIPASTDNAPAPTAQDAQAASVPAQ